MARLMFVATLLIAIFQGNFHRCSSTVLTAFPTNRLPLSSLAPESRATKNFDGRYRPWQTPTAIPYMFDPAAASTYSQAEQAVITSAMGLITTQMSNCIRFTAVPAANGVPGLFISKAFNNGTLPTTCQTFPGQHYNALNRPQKMMMIPNTGTGNNGCLSQREAMKLLVNALGLRDEWRRPTRDQCITVNPASIDPTIVNSLGGRPVTTAMTDPYGTSGNGAVDVMGTTFDFWSITIPAGDKWKNPNAVVGAVSPLWTYSATQGTTCPTPVTGGVIGGGGGAAIAPPPPGTLLPQLSQDDCRGLQAIYPTSCASVVCNDPYNRLPVPTIPLVAQPLPAAPITGTIIGGTPGGTGTVIGTPGTGLAPTFDANGNPILGGTGG